MGELSAVIGAVFTGISAVILAMSRWQASQIKDLMARVADLEAEQDEQKGLFREAVLFIRALMAVLRHEGIDGPEVPDTLREEI